MDKGDIELDIARDFAPLPGGRYRRYGPHSGEQFRDELLIPRLREAVENNVKLYVRIDTVKRSYMSSFIEESFGELVKPELFSPDEVRAHLVIISDKERFAFNKKMAEDAVEDSCRRQQA